MAVERAPTMSKSAFDKNLLTSLVVNNLIARFRFSIQMIRWTLINERKVKGQIAI